MRATDSIDIVWLFCVWVVSFFFASFISKPIPFQLKTIFVAKIAGKVRQKSKKHTETQHDKNVVKGNNNSTWSLTPRSNCAENANGRARACTRTHTDQTPTSMCICTRPTATKRRPSAKRTLSHQLNVVALYSLRSWTYRSIFIS